MAGSAGNGAAQTELGQLLQGVDLSFQERERAGEHTSKADHEQTEHKWTIERVIQLGSYDGAGGQ